MNQPIMLTPQDIINIVLALCGAIITISGAVGIIITLVNKAKAPNKRQDERITLLEADVRKINERLEEGNKRFDADAKRFTELETAMKATNKVIIESLQALTSHAIDGNNVQELKEAKKSLDDYLINRV